MSDPGREMYALMERLYPFCRSLTGDGVRRTLEVVGEQIPLQVTEVPSGTDRLMPSLCVPSVRWPKPVMMRPLTGQRSLSLPRAAACAGGVMAPVAASLALRVVTCV